jgi:hypothetical protein
MSLNKLLLSAVQTLQGHSLRMRHGPSPPHAPIDGTCISPVHTFMRALSCASREAQMRLEQSKGCNFLQGRCRCQAEPPPPARSAPTDSHAALSHTHVCPPPPPRARVAPNNSCTAPSHTRACRQGGTARELSTKLEPVILQSPPCSLAD